MVGHQSVKLTWFVKRRCRIENIVGIDKQEIRTSAIYESYLRKEILVINKRHMSIKEKFPLDLSRPMTTLHKVPINQIYTHYQSKAIIIFLKHIESFSIFDPRLLKTLYVKGYTNLVLKILVKFATFLKEPNTQVITS